MHCSDRGVWGYNGPQLETEDLNMIQDARVIAADRLKKRMQPKQVEQAIVRYMSDYFHVTGIKPKQPLSSLMQTLLEEHRDDTEFDFHVMVYQAIVEAVAIVIAQNNRDFETLRRPPSTKT